MQAANQNLPVLVLEGNFSYKLNPARKFEGDWELDRAVGGYVLVAWGGENIIHIIEGPMQSADVDIAVIVQTCDNPLIVIHQEVDVKNGREWDHQIVCDVINTMLAPHVR